MSRLMRRWRRSLQTRVVLSSLVLGALVIGLTGMLLLTSVADGLVQRRQDAVVPEAKRGFELAQFELDSEADDRVKQDTMLASLVDDLTQAKPSERSYDLVLQERATSNRSDAPLYRSSIPNGAQQIPAQVRKSVENSPGVYWHTQPLSIFGRAEQEPTIVVGSRVTSGQTGQIYELYYVYSLEDQQQTLDAVREAFSVGGLIMVFLVVAVVWLVSRQVLGPMRMARRVAERYASGSLEQRMLVSGEDDISRLSISFNQMAESLQRQIRRLEDLSRLQQRFVSDVSHELRTPLTTVQMAGEVLHASRGQFDPKTARAAELLKAELDRFEQLLSNLLDLSRFDAGAAQLELGAVDMAEVALRAQHDSVTAHLGVQVHVVGDRSPAIVQADVRRIARIVRNLLANAANYSGSSIVQVQVGQRDDRVSLVVRDFGLGLASEHRQRVFDRFWRADPARAQGGTGLGLAIAREDAVLHGGTLRVFSRSGKGAEFVLTLPREALTSDGSMRDPAVQVMFG